MAYAVTKAAQLQLVKCLGASQGPKIRVNTVLPGLLLTEWVCISPSNFMLHLPSCVYFPSLRKRVGRTGEKMADK
jgi:NAD(P)-dependent dehydrogenase (short-subunit alcohol dehydrogenase family)